MAETASSLEDHGNALFKNGEWLKAAAEYTKAIKLDPNSAVLHSNRAAALSKLNKVRQALADADKAIELDPSWAKGQFRRGCVLEEAGRFEEALPCFQKAADLDSQNPMIATKIRELGKVQRRARATRENSGSRVGEAAAVNAELRRLLHADVTDDTGGSVPMRVRPVDLGKAGMRRALIRCSTCGARDEEIFVALKRTYPESYAPVPHEAVKLMCLDCLARKAAEQGVTKTPAAVTAFADATLMGSVQCVSLLMGMPTEMSSFMPTVY